MKRRRSEENNSKNNDGAPEQLFTGMIFYMRPCGVRETIRDLLEAHGATFAKISNEKVFVLTDPCVHSYGYHVDFVHDSIKENKLQDIAKYKLPSYKYTADNHQIQIPANLMNKARLRYTPEEDEAIERYVAKFAAGDEQVGSIHGNVMWREMERKCATLHSWHSMKDRYINHIQPRAPTFTYAVLDVGGGGDVVSCNRKSVVSEQGDNSATELSTKSVNGRDAANKEFNESSQAERSVSEACSFMRISNVSVVIENLSGILKNNAAGPTKEMNSKMSENDHPDASDEVSDERLEDGVPELEAVASSARTTSKDNVSESTEEVDSKSLSENEPDAMEWVFSQETSQDLSDLSQDLSEDERDPRDKRLSEDSIRDATKEANCTKLQQNNNAVVTADEHTHRLSTTTLLKENGDAAFFTDSESESDDDDFDENLISEALKSSEKNISTPHTPTRCNINTLHTDNKFFRLFELCMNTSRKHTRVYCECFEGVDYSEALKRKERIEKIHQNDSLWTCLGNQLILRDVALKYGLSLEEVEQILLNKQS